MMPMPMWMVRAGEGSYAVDIFRENSIVAIGWPKAGDLKQFSKREEVLRKIEENYPDENRKWHISGGSQVYRFENEIKINDRVITYDSAQRVYLIGAVLSDSIFNPEIIEPYPRTRNVKWEGEIPRDKLSTQSKNSLGSTLTVFQPSIEASEELERLLAGSDADAPDEVEEGDQKFLLRETQIKSHEFIKDKVSKLGWEDMQDLVAGVLRAMGYKTVVSPAGPDQGKDIIASPDGFGFENPRIVVEVKHRKGTMGAQAIRSFLGGRHKDDKGLYVSTGGFSKDAKYEAERASIPLTLMNLDDLVHGITEHYENMDMDTRVLIPLTKLYWPAD